MTGGHAWFIGRQADGPEEVVKAVREQIRAGADVIKFIATGGVLTPGTSPGATQLTPEELRARSEEHTSELQSHSDLVCRLLLEKKKKEHNRRQETAELIPQRTT